MTKIMTAIFAFTFSSALFADGESVEGFSSFHPQNKVNNVLMVCKNAKTGEVVGEPKVSNPNWHWSGAESGCPKCNPDWCNQNVAECEVTKCITESTPVASAETDENSIEIEGNLGLD